MAKQKWQDKYKGRTSAMIIDPFFDGDYIEEYTVLKGIKFNGGEIHLNTFVKCCSFILDTKSPFIAAYPDLETRRKTVYEELGYRGYEDKVFEVLLLLRLYQDNEWTLYCAEQNVFYEFIVRANNPIKFDEMDEEKQMKAVILKDKYLDSLDKIIIRLEQRFKKIFLNDDSLQEVAKDLIVRNPEDYVKQKRNAISNT